MQHAMDANLFFFFIAGMRLFPDSRRPAMLPELADALEKYLSAVVVYETRGATIKENMALYSTVFDYSTMRNAFHGELLLNMACELFADNAVRHQRHNAAGFVRLVSRIFAYLDQYYMPRNHLPSIAELGTAITTEEGPNNNPQATARCAPGLRKALVPRHIMSTMYHV